MAITHIHNKVALCVLLLLGTAILSTLLTVGARAKMTIDLTQGKPYCYRAVPVLAPESITFDPLDFADAGLPYPPTASSTTGGATGGYPMTRMTLTHVSGTATCWVPKHPRTNWGCHGIGYWEYVFLERPGELSVVVPDRVAAGVLTEDYKYEDFYFLNGAFTPMSEKLTFNLSSSPSVEIFPGDHLVIMPSEVYRGHTVSSAGQVCVSIAVELNVTPTSPSTPVPTASPATQLPVSTAATPTSPSSSSLALPSETHPTATPDTSNKDGEQSGSAIQGCGQNVFLPILTGVLPPLLSADNVTVFPNYTVVAAFSGKLRNTVLLGCQSGDERRCSVSALMQTREDFIGYARCTSSLRTDSSDVTFRSDGTALYRKDLNLSLCEWGVIYSPSAGSSTLLLRVQCALVIHHIAWSPLSFRPQMTISEIPIVLELNDGTLGAYQLGRATVDRFICSIYPDALRCVGRHATNVLKDVVLVKFTDFLAGSGCLRSEDNPSDFSCPTNQCASAGLHTATITTCFRNDGCTTFDLSVFFEGRYSEEVKGVMTIVNVDKNTKKHFAPKEQYVYQFRTAFLVPGVIVEQTRLTLTNSTGAQIEVMGENAALFNLQCERGPPATTVDRTKCTFVPGQVHYVDPFFDAGGFPWMNVTASFRPVPANARRRADEEEETLVLLNGMSVGGVDEQPAVVVVVPPSTTTGTPEPPETTTTTTDESTPTTTSVDPTTTATLPPAPTPTPPPSPPLWRSSSGDTTTDEASSSSSSGGGLGGTVRGCFFATAVLSFVLTML